MTGPPGLPAGRLQGRNSNCLSIIVQCCDAPILPSHACCFELKLSKTSCDHAVAGYYIQLANASAHVPRHLTSCRPVSRCRLAPVCQSVCLLDCTAKISHLGVPQETVLQVRQNVSTVKHARLGSDDLTSHCSDQCVCRQAGQQQCASTPSKCETRFTRAYFVWAPCKEPYFPLESHVSTGYVIPSVCSWSRVRRGTCGLRGSLPEEREGG